MQERYGIKNRPTSSFSVSTMVPSSSSIGGSDEDLLFTVTDSIILTN